MTNFLLPVFTLQWIYTAPVCQPFYSSRADGLVAQTEPVKAKVPSSIQGYVVFSFVFVVNCLHSFQKVDPQTKILTNLFKHLTTSRQVL